MASTSPRPAEVVEIEGAVLGTYGDFAWIDIGNDGLAVTSAADVGSVPNNQKLKVFLKGSDPENLYVVSTAKPVRMKGWSDFNRAFERHEIITAVVTGAVRGGFSVDLGAPAFLPTSRSGARDAVEAEQLINKEIACRIVELDSTDENIVVDRREILEAVDMWSQQRALQELHPGTRVKGKVCTLTDFGAFVDLGGIDGLLHVRDIARHRVEKPSDVLALGQEIEVLVEKVDPKRGRVSLSLKALQDDPWAAIAGAFKPGDRVQGTVTTVTDFGAFVELRPGVEGLVHLSDLTWSKRPLRPSEVITAGETAEFIVLAANPSERRIALSRKQAQEDPWKTADQQFPVGAIVTGEITSLTNFGAFVDLNGSIEGMIHIADISTERVSHPSDVLAPGGKVRARVLECDGSRQRLRLSLKQVQQMPEPTPTRETPPVIVDRPAAVTEQPDFSHYGKSVFLNFPVGKAHRIVTDAIAFAILDCGFVPRFFNGDGGFHQLLRTTRECRYAVHEISRKFEAGLFAGCLEFGGDLHRIKQAMVLTAGEGEPSFGGQALSYGNDPAEAARLVVGWLSRQDGSPLDWSGVWSRYQGFRQELPALCSRSGFPADELSAANWLSLAQEWLLANPRKQP
jgi:small subunit ribosomal protein S1